jgi:uncharacterized membrane protein (TIGR02234 family)
MTTPHPRRPELPVAVLGCLLGAATILFAAGATWVRLRVTAIGDGTGVAAALPVRLSGGAVAPAVTGLGLVGLAGVVAIAATRRSGRIVVGILVLGAGLAVSVVAARVGFSPAAAARGTTQVHQLAPAGTATFRDVAPTAAPWVACVGGVLLAAAGLLVAARGRRWSQLSARHDAPTARPVSVWDSIERGEDPT